MVVVVVLMGDRVRLGLVGGKTAPPPPPPPGGGGGGGVGGGKTPPPPPPPMWGSLLAEASSPRPPNTKEKKPLIAGNTPGDPICLPPCKTSGNFRNFAELYLRSFKTYHLQT